MKLKKTKEIDNLFESFKDNILSVDPVYFIENNLTLDGETFKINGNGYKPFSDIYRYIGTKAIEEDAKPVVLVKGRQVGATTMAAALECYFMGCGLYGNNHRPPMRIMHLFPTLSLAAAYTKTKLEPMINAAKPVPGEFRKNGTLKSCIEIKMDTSSTGNDNLQFKKFEGENQVWIESTGLDGDRVRGRQLSLDTELPTPNGFITMGSVKVGDKLFDENGNICNVTKVHPINLTPEAYKITFDDGTVVEACAEHLWATQTKRERRLNKKPTIRNTKEIFETLKIYGESNHSISLCKPVKYPEKELLLDPYLLGIWLGDGARGGQIETADPEILQSFKHRIVKSTINAKSNWCDSSRSCSYRVIGLTTKLTKLGLIKNYGPKQRAQGKLGFYNKHIPDDYMYSSYSQRLALLQGLMDSDGCCYKHDKRCEFTQVESREKLAFQVFDLIRSLGIKATIVKKPGLRYGVRYQDKYCILFRTTLPVFRLERKLTRLGNKIVKAANRFIRNIERIESKPMRCITVDSTSHLYLITRSFIPTHNTIEICLFDEVQDISVAAIGASVKTLAQAKYGAIGKGVQVYFGTPKQKGTNYHEMWKMSSQQYYHLGCENCGDYFPLYRPDINWEDVWLYGYIVKCTHCGHEQDKRPAAERGKWISFLDILNESADKIGGVKDVNSDETVFIGYHINQLYIPRFTKETILSERPENNPNNTERTFQNEVLGEFYDGEGGTISPDEIFEKCSDKDRAFAKEISPPTLDFKNINNPNAQWRRVYAGFDWGQKGDLHQMTGRQRGQSYSCGVILTVPQPNLFQIEFATRFERVDLQSKIDVVEEMFRRFSVFKAVGDIGDAHDLTHIFQKKYTERFLASRAAPKVNSHIKYNNDIFPKEIVFERDYYISELIGLIKQGNVRFPMKSYDRVMWLVSHCCSMEIKVTTSRSGDPVRRFIKGATPNDGFMALLNAYLAYKFDITQGFTIKQPQFMKITNTKQKSNVPAVLGYMTKMR